YLVYGDTGRFREEARSLLAFVGLEARSGERAGALPYGQQRMLEIARALATRPRLFMLDEPAAGLNAAEVDFLLKRLEQIGRQGVAGAMPPRRGRIIFSGRDITSLPAYRRALAGIALVPEGRRVFPALTVRENLEMGGFKFRTDRGKLRSQMERVMEMFPRLRERAGQAAGTLSGGEQQMLALSRALMSEPRLLCMDEPSLGL